METEKLRKKARKYAEKELDELGITNRVIYESFISGYLRGFVKGYTNTK